MVHRRLFLYLFTLNLVIVACSNTPTLTPVTTQPQSTSTLPPPPTVMSQATPIRPSATLILNNTPYPPTKTHIPTPTPASNLVLVAAATTDDYYSLLNVTLSSRGQLAYILDGHLLVETDPGSKTFQDLGPGAQIAAWSPDGSQLAYSMADFDLEPSRFEQFLWTAETNTETKLSQRIPDFPDPPYKVYKIFWSPDSSKILLWAHIDDRHAPVEGGPFSVILSVVDLNQQTFTDNQVVPSRQLPVWLTNDNYILRYDVHLSDAVIFSANDYTGQESWSLEWATFGIAGFAPDASYMINAGRIDGRDERGVDFEARPATIDKINLATGEVETIWQINPQTPDRYFASAYPIQISSDGKYLTFSSNDRLDNHYSVMLHLIDQEGKEIGVYPDSYAHNWRPNGGLVVSDSNENGESRIIYIELDGSKEIVYETQNAWTIIKGGDSWLDNEGVWNSNGRIFLFATRDNEAKIERLHLWQPGQGPPIIIFTGFIYERILDFFWVPNTQTFYFYTTDASGNLPSKLWRYDLN